MASEISLHRGRPDRIRYPSQVDNVPKAMVTLAHMRTILGNSSVALAEVSIDPRGHSQLSLINASARVLLPRQHIGRSSEKA